MYANDEPIIIDRDRGVKPAVPMNGVSCFPGNGLILVPIRIDRPDAVTCIDGNGVPKDRAAKEAFARWRFRELREFTNVVEEAREK